MTPRLNLSPVRASAIALIITMGGFASAQEATLPQSPSAVLAAQTDAQARPAGSGYIFKAAGSISGPGGAAIEQAQPAALPLSLDDAISLGLDRNVRLKFDRANLRAVKGYNLGVTAVLTPNLKFDAQSTAQEVNLAAMGFKPALFAKFAASGLLPPGFSIPTIVKVNTTQAQVSLDQVLFSMPDYEVYRGTKNETAVVELTNLSDRGEVVQTVGADYLLVLADKATLANALAQETAAETLLGQAQARQDAGVGVHLDTLRAKVQYQQRQQEVVRARGQLAKDTIQLARVCGLPAGQALDLTDTAPFAQLAEMDLEAAKATAYLHRKDLLGLDQQRQLAARLLKAVKFQRLPTLAVNGYYGIIGLTTGSYHGNFVAQGTVKVPVFREAGQRGEEQTIEAQLTSLRQREQDLRVTIDAQIRAAMLDVTSTQELVRVAQSNVQLSQQQLSDETDRFKAGVVDDLPVVDAEASVTSAQAQLVQSLYQFNVAKLTLARATGVVETRYRTYLGN